MNDREIKHLMDKMHASADGVLSAELHLQDDEFAEDTEIFAQAQELKDKSALRLARVTTAFIEEIIKRRHETGNYQYPFEPFDEYPDAGRNPS